MGSLIRIKEMSWKEANALLSSSHDDIKLEGFLVKTNSQRYVLFRKSRMCVSCGKIGTRMCLEYHSGNRQKRAHFNLYTTDGVLMTKDHIIPKSRGGRNAQDNYQTMCLPCNSRKGNFLCAVST